MWIILLILVSICIKWYSGPAQAWIEGYLGGIPYVIFWCLLIYWIFPDCHIELTVLAVVAITCLIEFSQLWQPTFLQAVRHFYLGRLLLGHSFSWADFPFYFIGGFLSWRLLHRFETQIEANKKLIRSV